MKLGYDLGMNLSAEQLRVLGCLIEKAATTPDAYPLSSNALTNACNQKSSRDPVVAYSVRQVDEVMQQLRDVGWARSVRTAGSRATKHKHVAEDKLGLDSRGLAIVAVLALRGPQSAGELKTRTERYETFESVEQVYSTLEALETLSEPLVRNVGRQSGQSQDRWVQLLSDSEGQVGVLPQVAQTVPETLAGAESSLDVVAKVKELERRVETLENAARSSET